MDIVELKSKIENNCLDDSILILKYSDNPFLCHHYIKHIAKNKNLEIIYINSIDELENDSDLFDFKDSTLKVLSVDDLKEIPDVNIKNAIVVCKSVPKDLSVDYTDIPKLLNWQIEDFVKLRLPGLKDIQVKWLCENSKYDIYRLDNECKKLEIFPEAFQEILFKEQSQENAFCDLNSNSIFNLTEAIFKKDKNSIKDVLLNREYIDLEPAGLVSILLKNYYKLLTVISTSSWNSNMESIISEKQYRFYKAVYGKQYSISGIVSIYDVLTSIDYKLKSGLIDYDIIIDYLIIKLLEGIVC